MVELPFDWSLLPEEERVLAAVSSGADSLALLLALHQAGRDVLVAHINHGLKLLRGNDCNDDEAFVVAHCREIGVPVVTARVEVPHRHGHAAEEPARVERYQALARLAREHGCPRVATGHTASDVLETVLINWLRGATVSGLAGIPPQRMLAPGVLLVRPLLSSTREETAEACRRAGWAWREDASNRDARFLRNRVRHEVLPLLEQIMGPEHSSGRLARQVERSGALLRDDLDYLHQTACEHLWRLLRPTREHPGQPTLAMDGVGFRELHPALQRRVLRAAVEQLRGHTRDVTAAQIEEVRRHVEEERRRRVWQWRGGLSVEWTGAMAGNRLRLWLVSKDV